MSGGQHEAAAMDDAGRDVVNLAVALKLGLTKVRAGHHGVRLSSDYVLGEINERLAPLGLQLRVIDWTKWDTT